MATFWETAAHSVDHMFSLYIDYLKFELFLVFVLRAGLIWILIAPVPAHSILVTSTTVSRFTETDWN